MNKGGGIPLGGWVTTGKLIDSTRIHAEGLAGCSLVMHVACQTPQFFSHPPKTGEFTGKQLRRNAPKQTSALAFGALTA